MPLPMLAPIAVGALGSLFGAFGANSAAKKQAKAQAQAQALELAERRRQFDASHGLDVGRANREQGDYDLKRSSIAATSPQRQQIMAALMQRFGLGGGGPKPGGLPPMPPPQPQQAMPATAGPPQGDQSEMLRQLVARFGGGGR